MKPILKKYKDKYTNLFTKKTNITPIRIQSICSKLKITGAKFNIIAPNQIS